MASKRVFSTTYEWSSLHWVCCSQGQTKDGEDSDGDDTQLSDGNQSYRTLIYHKYQISQSLLTVEVDGLDMFW